MDAYLMHEVFLNEIAPSYKDIKPNSIFYKTWGETVFDERVNNNPEVQDLSYIMNNYAHRCDDFKIEHSDKHILFAGCSFTFGEGLIDKGNWSNKLYSMFQNKYACDGYYALGFQNGITSVIINNIFKYFEKFGEPEILFCLFPDSVRKHDLDADGNIIIDYRHDERHKAMGRINSYHSIYFLEKYCNLKGIKLIWSTWDRSDSDFYSNINFNNFFKFEDVDVYMNSKNSHEKNNPFYEIARDRAHPGLRYSDGLARLFYNEYMVRYER